MSNLSFVAAYGTKAVKLPTTPDVSITPMADGGYAVAYIPPPNSVSLSPPEYVYSLEEAIRLASVMQYSLRMYNQQVEQSERQGRRRPRSYGRKFYKTI